MPGPACSIARSTFVACLTSMSLCVCVCVCVNRLHVMAEYAAWELVHGGPRAGVHEARMSLQSAAATDQGTDTPLPPCIDKPTWFSNEA